MASNFKTLEKARAALQRNDFAKAEALLTKINSAPRGRGKDSLLMYGLALEPQKKFRAAAEAFEMAAAHTDNPGEKAQCLNKACDLLNAAPDRTEADTLRVIGNLEQSLELGPGRENVRSRLHLCSIYYARHDYKGLMTHAAELIPYREHSTQANLWMAFACFFLDRKAEGLAHLENVAGISASLGTDDAFALLDLLTFYDAHDIAQAVIDGAPDSQKQTYWMREFQADIYVGTRNYPAALAILSIDAIEACVDEPRRRRLYSIRAKCLDATGDYAAAHASFTAMNVLARRSAADHPPSDIAGRYLQMPLTDLPSFRISEPAPYNPVFMIGFPRSGTTLLDTILDTQPRILTFSEFDGMTFARRAMEALGKQYPEDLPALDEAELRHIRAAYLERNSHYISDADIVDVMIDKLPLNLIQIPLIITLFPEAKFILSLRHPADVCLSCFQQDFMLNGEMIYFTDLEECFGRYRDVMTLLERYRKELNLDMHIVKYEELTSDLEGVANGVFEFLGVEPNADYRNFHLLNREKTSCTPSRSQVVKPMYKSSCNRWRNYAENIEPLLPIVQPFIEKFGFEND